MKLKEAIAELELAPDVDIFISIYGKPESEIVCQVQDVDAKFLKQKVKVIQKNHGGIEYNYGCYKFILM